jgi:DNA-directed RNA polymerase specialized sigma24 family protein
MAAETDDSERVLEAWRAGRVTRTALYEAVADTLHQGARRGITATIAQPANEDDVGNVVYDAFCELERKDPLELRSLLGMANRIAFQRGRDRGRTIVKERENIKTLVQDPALHGELEFHDEDLQVAQRREVLAQIATECLDGLTAEQRSVVAATVMEPMSLSDWALREGKSHQAASRQRTRALEALHRCVDRKLRSQQDGKEYRHE